MDNENKIMKKVLTMLVVTIAIIFVYFAFDIIAMFGRRTYPQTPAPVYSEAVIPEGGNAKMSYRPDPITDRGPVDPSASPGEDNGPFDITDIDKAISATTDDTTNDATSDSTD